jgi:hypothetical protein
MAEWTNMAVQKPINNQIVWIRILNYYDDPFLAQYKVATQIFTTVNTSINIPAYQVARWKSQ